MADNLSRRQFIATGIGALAAAKNLSGTRLPQAKRSELARLAKSPFKVAVITDEISQDFGHACEVASQQFGMGWVEIRSAWKKNIANFDAQEISEILSVLKKHNLPGPDIASSLFKTEWADPPKSKFAEKNQIKSNFPYPQKD